MSKESDNSPDESSSKNETEEAAKNRTPKSFKPTKIIGFPQRRINITFEGDNGQPSGIIQIKKRKIESLFVKILPKNKKNPDKFVLASIGHYPLASQIYTYKNNESYVYVHKGVDYVRLDREEFYYLLVQIIQVLAENEEMRNSFIAASLALQLKKYKRPFFKIGIDKIQEFKLEDMIEEFKRQSQEKERVWK